MKLSREQLRKLKVLQAYYKKKEKRNFKSLKSLLNYILDSRIHSARVFAYELIEEEAAKQKLDLRKMFKRYRRKR